MKNVSANFAEDASIQKPFWSIRIRFSIALSFEETQRYSCSGGQYHGEAFLGECF